MGYARQVLGDIPQGNLDPIALQGPEEMIRRKGAPNHRKSRPQRSYFQSWTRLCSLDIDRWYSCCFG